VGSLVYVDEAFVETARDAWGIRQMMGAGAVNVCGLEAATPQDADRAEVLNPGDRSIEKVVLFTGKLLHESYPDILRLLTTSAGRFSSCTIFTTTSEETYSSLAPTEMRLYPFESFKEKLLSQLQDLTGFGARGFHLDIRSCPLVYCPRSAGVFTIPTPCGLSQGLRGDLDVADSKYYQSSEFDLTDYEEDISPGLAFLARTLSEMCSHMCWDAHVFAQGRVSKVLAKEVASMDRKRGKQAQQSVSLVLLDRALDLVTPACHADSDLDRLAEDSLLTAGSITQPTDRAALSWFDLICSQRAKDASCVIRRELKEALLKEHIPDGVRGKLGAITVDELSKLKSSLEGTESRKQKYASLLQYADLVIQGLGPELSKKWDFLVAVEEVLLHLSLDSPEMPIQYLLDLVSKIKSNACDSLSTSDLERLAFIAHILVSLKFGRQEESTQGDGILRDFLTDLYLSEKIRDEGESKEVEIQKKIGATLERLEKATSVCCKLNKESPSLLGLRHTFRPLISSTLDLLSGSNSSEEEALKYVPGSLGGLLASGLGRFGFKSKPKVSDSDVAVIFVLGQISPLEVKLCAECRAEGKTVVLGALDVTRPDKFAATFRNSSD